VRARRGADSLWTSRAAPQQRKSLIALLEAWVVPPGNVAITLQAPGLGLMNRVRYVLSVNPSPFRSALPRRIGLLVLIRTQTPFLFR